MLSVLEALRQEQPMLSEVFAWEGCCKVFPAHAVVYDYTVKYSVKLTRCKLTKHTIINFCSVPACCADMLLEFLVRNMFHFS
jgi:hypothetical protein